VRPTTILRQHRLKTEHAKSSWGSVDPETSQVVGLVITIDPRLLGLVQAVIHELIHVYFVEHTRFFYTLSEDVEEAMVVALARDLAEYLETPSRTPLLDSWSKAIQRKLD
jgi:hypothetical protein